jgi:hypothetical protein
MRRASSIAARANAARLLAAYFLSNTFLVFGLTQCVRAQAVQVTGSYVSACSVGSRVIQPWTFKPVLGQRNENVVIEK